jgi:hypothetical protein
MADLAVLALITVLLALTRVFLRVCERRGGAR